MRYNFLKYHEGNNGYALTFFFFEMMNMVNLILNIGGIDYMLGGHFYTYGFLYLDIDYVDQRNRIISEIFPKITKCMFPIHGPGGDINIRMSYHYYNFTNSC